MYSIKLATINVIGRPCICFPLSINLSTGFKSVKVHKRRQEDRTSHISSTGHLRDRCSPHYSDISDFHWTGICIVL